MHWIQFSHQHIAVRRKTHNDTPGAACSINGKQTMEVATDVKDFVAAHKGLFAVLENGKVGDILGRLSGRSVLRLLEAASECPAPSQCSLDGWFFHRFSAR